jgi:cytochrome b561
MHACVPPHPPGACGRGVARAVLADRMPGRGLRAGGVLQPEMKSFLMKWHSQLGLLVLAALVPRVLIRLATAHPPHLPGPMLEQLGSRVAHGALYVLMGAVPLTGAAMLYLGGNSMPFFGLEIPGKQNATDSDTENAKTMASLHSVTLGPIFELLVPLVRRPLRPFWRPFRLRCTYVTSVLVTKY